jgi:transposase-like protein
MNKLDTPKRAMILRCLTEGSGIRPTARMMGCAVNTVVSLFEQAGHWCWRFHDERVRLLDTTHLQLDEMWHSWAVKSPT